MGSDTAHSLVPPVTWRAMLGIALAALAVHLLATTQYYATIFFLALLTLVLMFGVARLLQQRQNAAESLAANRAITRLQAEQKWASRTQDHLQALLDTVSAALLVLKDDGRVAAANRAARLLLRGEAPRLSDITAIGAGAAQAISHLALGSHAVVRLANGQQMLASASHFAGGGESLRLVSLQAVVGELDAVQLKAWEDMSRVLAHEIMNSLTPIASLSESLSAMIRREGAGRDTVEAVDTIARRSQGLVAFVGRYRQMAELPEPRLQTLALRDFLSEIDTLMRTRLDGLGYISQVEPEDLSAVADPGQLSQAVINLLHNAADAVSEVECPAITLSCRREQDRIVISVSDNGKGVPAQFTEDIFVPFFTTKPQGSGIGLSIVRQIALKHGGQVTVSQNSAGGATFTLSLAGR